MIIYLRLLSQQVRLLKSIGIKNYLHYRLAKNGAVVPITINGIGVCVRKGTPDLSVAESCLYGEFENLRHLLPVNYDGAIVDAGGYIGTAAIALNKMFPCAKVITIEPSNENLLILKRNVEGRPNIKVIHGALIAGRKEMLFLKNRGTGQWGFTVVDNPKDKLNADVLHEAAAVNLSSLGVDVENIGILKLDIEGGELDLLRNDIENLKKIDNIIIELHDRIVDGCTDAFFEFSKDRIIIKDRGEKYLSIKR